MAFILDYDLDPYKPGQPPFTPDELNSLARKYESTAPPTGPHKPVADVNNDEEQPAPAAPVAKAPKPVPVAAAPEKKIVHLGTTLVITRARKEKTK
jgi:hypothetical protein